jgi:hydroxymethylbilane synthase
MKRIIRLGTRGSRLALIQAGWVRDKLKEVCPSAQVEIVPIQTKGDRMRTRSFGRYDDTGLFTKTIEDALLRNEVDAAVHSLKDLPTVQPAGLAVIAVPERLDPHDALVSRDGLAMEQIKEGMRVGTSSVRRRAQLLALNNEIDVVDLRGNLDTRIKRLSNGKFDAIVVAMAGLIRMRRDDVNAVPIPFETMLPAAGQGALAIEAREDDSKFVTVFAGLNHEESAVTTRAERMVLRLLGAGCHVPIGVLAEYVGGGDIRLRCGVFSRDGQTTIRASSVGSDAQDAVNEIVNKLDSQGARGLIDEPERNV